MTLDLRGEVVESVAKRVEVVALVELSGLETERAEHSLMGGIEHCARCGQRSSMEDVGVLTDDVLAHQMSPHGGDLNSLPPPNIQLQS